MSQAVTITQSGGKAVTVNIDVDDGKSDNISDDEAKAAFDAALEQPGVTSESLAGGTMTIGKTSLAADRYTALTPPAVPSPDAEDAAAGVSLFSRHQLHLNLLGSVLGLNGVEGGFGVGAGYSYNTPVSEDGETVLGVGLGLLWQKMWMNPTGIDLTQENHETGVTGRDFTGQHQINPYAQLSLLRMVTPNIGVGGLLRAGLGVIVGDDTEHRRTGDQYGNAYCPPGSGGVFGDDVTGCENRPFPSYAQPGANNDSTEGGTELYFRGQAGPMIEGKVAGGRVGINGSVGLDVLGGENSRVGGYGQVGVSVGLDEPAPASGVSDEPGDKDGDGVDDDKDQCPGTLAGVEVNAKGCPIEEEDLDGDGVTDDKDKCPDVAGTKENKGCLALEAKVTKSPETLKPQEKFLLGLNVNTTARVKVSFKDEAGTVTNSNSVLIEEGNTQSEFTVPDGLKAGKYKLIVTFVDVATNVKKVEEREITILENVTGDMPATFPPNQKPFIKDLKVVGMEMLDGVTFEIEGFDKDKKSVGTVKSDQALTLTEKGSEVIFQNAPEQKGWRKDVKYTLVFRNKAGQVVLTKTFEMGEAPPPPPAPKGGPGRRKRV